MLLQTDLLFFVQNRLLSYFSLILRWNVGFLHLRLCKSIVRGVWASRNSDSAEKLKCVCVRECLYLHKHTHTLFSGEISCAWKPLSSWGISCVGRRHFLHAAFFLLGSERETVLTCQRPRASSPALPVPNRRDAAAALHLLWRLLLFLLTLFY